MAYSNNFFDSGYDVAIVDNVFVIGNRKKYLGWGSYDISHKICSILYFLKHEKGALN